MSKLQLFFKTVLTSIAAAIVYGLIHDQITIRICPEYFTVWHPHIVDTNNLTVLAIVWGIVATWWVGASLGILLGACATIGRKPVPSFRYIARWICGVLICSGIGAIMTGLVFWLIRIDVPIWAMSSTISAMSPDVQRRFAIDLAIHNASYNVSPIVAIIASLFILRKRRNLAPSTIRVQKS